MLQDDIHPVKDDTPVVTEWYANVLHMLCLQYSPRQGLTVALVFWYSYSTKVTGICMCIASAWLTWLCGKHQMPCKLIQAHFAVLGLCWLIVQG